MKIIFRIFILILVSIFLLIFYLSFIGIETNKFNNQIQIKVKEIDKNLSLDLNKVKLTLNPLKLRLNAKTIGPSIIIKENRIELENIKTNISLKSLFINEFSLEKLEISTKTIEIKDLLSFYNSVYQVPEIIFLEKIFKVNGYLIANIKLEFDQDRKLKDNYVFKGFIKDAKFNLINDFNIKKLNLLFDFSKNKFSFSDIKFQFNDLDFNSKSINIEKNQDYHSINGNIFNDNIKLDEKNISFLKDKYFPYLNIKTIDFSSDNNFSLDIDKKFKLQNIKINSTLNINQAKISHKYNLKNFFPNISNEIILSKNKLKLDYKKKNFKIIGQGDILLQNNNDSFSFNFEKSKNKFIFRNVLKIKENPFLFNFLNYKKNEKVETVIKIDGFKNLKNELFFNLISLSEGDNKIDFTNISFDKNNKFNSLDTIEFKYFDRDNEKNSLKLFRKNKYYVLKGDFFNVQRLIQSILLDDNQNEYLNKDLKFKLDLKKIRLDNDHKLNDVSGYLNFKDKKLINGNLSGNFDSNKKMNFVVKSSNDKIVTTLYIDYAKPIIRHYDFIKGFDEGILDFYSSSDGRTSNSTLKIYDFKLKELPTLTKILTLASLQGIADILSGEGIRFNELEMNFKSSGELMTINEIYAIGPAISILMEGYIEKKKLVSLRGTLVPATTINKAIGSIPILGKILVGSKTGEGVFGVSFKIKGPPKKLETTVNPIKTLTPRFITRTLEKIKKTN